MSWERIKQWFRGLKTVKNKTGKTNETKIKTGKQENIKTKKKKLQSLYCGRIKTNNINKLSSFYVGKSRVATL